MYAQSSTKADNCVAAAQSGNYRKPFSESDIKSAVAFLISYFVPPDDEPAFSAHEYGCCSDLSGDAEGVIP
jgi:hypothetical protein